MKISELKSIIREVIVECITEMEHSVTHNDINQVSPKSAIDMDNIDFSKLTASNVKALLKKSYRSLLWLKQNSPEDQNSIKREQKNVELLKKEIRRRVDYINAPVGEGYGAGKPEEDRLMKKGDRWTVQFK